ncbi:MAG: 30S ribosomal protein S20 [Candidatus Magasanikbacteria bacterium]|nr:30S ribosomal protein S20 [Candidatus Magasanikbacteria bacterium]
MPNKPAAAKHLRQTKTRAARNLARLAAYRTAIKKVLKAAGPDQAAALLRQAQQALDKAARRGVIKKNTAARKLSRLMKKVQTP